MKFVKASLCLSIALAITACGQQVSVESHLENAKNNLSQNKVNESIIDLKNAIRTDNKNPEARFLLGQIYLNLGDGAAAVKELERANEYSYTPNQVIPLLARAYVLTDSDMDVLALNEKSTTLDNQAQSRYLAYKTLAALRSNSPEQAKESVALSQTLGQEGIYSILASAYLALSESQYDAAKQLISKILTLDTQQVDALMLQGQVAMVTKEYQQAAVSFKSYLNLQPRSGIVQLLLADALLKSGQDDEAEKYADNILAKVDTQPFAHYIKAMVAFNRKAFDKSSEHAELALSADFNQFNLKLVAGASAFYLKNWQQSYHHLIPVVKHLPTDHQARRMLAVTQLELGLVDEINTTIGDFEGGKVGDAQFLSSMSYKLLELGATNEAKKVLAQNENSPSNNAKENARQGILKLMMNDPSGIQNLEEAIALDPDFIEAELALAYAALKNNDINKARDIATKWQNNYPKKAGGYNLAGSIAIKEKSYNQAEMLLKQGLQLEPDNLFGLMEQLRLARQQQNESLSQQRVDYLITLQPNNNKVLRHYFGIYHNEMALEKLQDAYQSNTEDTKKALLVAEAMVSLAQYKQANILLTSLAKTPKLPKIYWKLVIFNHQKQNEMSKVQSTLESWFKASPYHIEPIMLLADLHASAGNNERALTMIKRGLEYHTDNIVLQLIEMQLLLNSKQIEPARNLYKIIAKSNINDALKQGFLGRILLLEKKHDQAIPKLSTLYQVYPSSQNAIYLARAYMVKNKSTKAVETLEHYLTIDENDNRIKTMLASIHLEGDTNKAIKVYEDVIIKQPTNIVAHNNLAWLYSEQGKSEQALKHAKEAFRLAPHVANIVDTYGQVLLKSGDKAAALKYASQASKIAEGKDVAIQLNYIAVLIANNLKNEASNLLSKVVPKTVEHTQRKAKLELTL